MIRSQWNKQFVESEILTFDGLFQNIEGKRLDEQQKVAVVTDEDNNLVIAGAGSGKTTTIVGKVRYLQRRHKVRPSDVLLISFTNKSAASLAERIGEEGFEALTFHKFGLRVIAESEGIKPSIYDESRFPLFLKEQFDELSGDAAYLKNLTDYFLQYLKPPKSQFEFQSQGEYIQYLKDQSFRTYKPVPVNVRGIITLQREAVKSIEECLLANYLLFNGINYEYERKYEFDTATLAYQQYTPDFTILANGSKIYLEHFALSASGDVPEFFAKQGETYQAAKTRYWEKIDWARELHQTNGTPLIETFSHQFAAGTVFDHLEAQLLAHGVKLSPLSVEQKWEKIQDAARDEIESILSLCGTFITLLKSNDYTFDDLERKNKDLADPFMQRRNSAFFGVVRPLFDRYTAELNSRKEIDFSDMINKATQLIRSKKYQRTYKYVIVDEFQDISIGRYKLLQAIKSADRMTRLFCVGDDWQSIYRFTGSDIALFKNFQDYFGATERSNIETTYRYSVPLLTVSNTFIAKNPNQSNKMLRPLSNALSTPYFLKYSSDDDDTLILIQVFNQILAENDSTSRPTVFILGRYSFDIKRIKNESKSLQIDAGRGLVRYVSQTVGGVRRMIEASYMTVHKAKGLEADIVIILNCNSGLYGFPGSLSDDQVLNLLLSEADQFEDGEERRLFYVAMTRAKRAVYFISDSYRKSKFVLELEVDQQLNTDLKCPECRTADLVLRKTGVAKTGAAYRFYGCSNYVFGCGYTNTLFS
jgi:DNA helicase-4